MINLLTSLLALTSLSQNGENRTFRVLFLLQPTVSKVSCFTMSKSSKFLQFDVPDLSLHQSLSCSFFYLQQIDLKFSCLTMIKFKILQYSNTLKDFTPIEIMVKSVSQFNSIVNY